MPAQRKYPDELRERAVRMVLEVHARDGKGHGELARVGRQPAATFGSNRPIERVITCSTLLQTATDPAPDRATLVVPAVMDRWRR